MAVVVNPGLDRSGSKSSGESSGGTVGLAVGLGFLFIVLLILMITLWSCKRKKAKASVADDTVYSMLKHNMEHEDFATRGTNMLDLVYTNIPGAYHAEPCPYLGNSDHCYVDYSIQTARQTPKTRVSLKQVNIWQTRSISALQDCFECTDWNMFREAATNGDSINLEEYTTSVTSYIGKCIDDVTVSKTITTRSNQKPWMTAEVRALLKRDN
ncbi:hypothetical protein QTP86_015546 [Hemibagrus guttatus]|nr:hypothetical protein QTP86_015546 [Hemibagrus guttatus]